MGKMTEKISMKQLPLPVRIIWAYGAFSLLWNILVILAKLVLYFRT